MLRLEILLLIPCLECFDVWVLAFEEVQKGRKLEVEEMWFWWRLDKKGNREINSIGINRARFLWSYDTKHFPQNILERRIWFFFFKDENCWKHESVAAATRLCLQGKVAKNYYRFSVLEPIYFGATHYMNMILKG